MNHSGFFAFGHRDTGMSIYAEANALFASEDDTLGEDVTFGAVTVKAVKNEVPVEMGFEPNGIQYSTNIEFEVRRELLATKPAHKSNVIYKGTTYKVTDVTEDEVFYNVKVYKPS